MRFALRLNLADMVNSTLLPRDELPFQYRKFAVLIYPCRNPVIACRLHNQAVKSNLAEEGYPRVEFRPRPLTCGRLSVHINLGRGYSGSCIYSRSAPVIIGHQLVLTEFDEPFTIWDGNSEELQLERQPLVLAAHWMELFRGPAVNLRSEGEATNGIPE